eukprot:6450956-Pyramimonas_sp.AAC.1
MSERSSHVDSRFRRSGDWCSGTSQNRQRATITVTVGVEVPRMVFWHNCGCSIGCLPKEHFLMNPGMSQ